MDDKRLRALLTAVQCGSFGKATAQLGYTQSAMTHMVNKLEAELGCTLLTRSSHGVRLSEEGEHLLPYIQDYLRASETLRREAAAQGEAHNRVLRIGCFASIARARLPALLQKFRKLHPEIKIDVLVGGYELAAALEEERVQLALVEETCAREGLGVEVYQSNHEGDIVDKIQAALGKFDGIVINPAAYTHTSVAILDALKAVALPAVEVHISDVSKREEFRQVSYARLACIKTYMGLGLEGYRQAILYLKDYLTK